MSIKQKTIQKEVSINGIGLHTGNEVLLTFKPAPANTGLIFRRTDLEGQPELEALASYVTDTRRGTSLEKKGVVINTSEHVLAAIVGLDIDNIYIELNAPEPPIMDGSSMSFVESLEEAQVIEQDTDREYYEVKEIISFKDEETGSEIMMMPSDKYEITTMVDFGTKILGTQNASIQDIKEFKKEIAGARTFSFLHEIEMLLENDLIKGGDLNNAIVYVDKKISDKTIKN